MYPEDPVRGLDVLGRRCNEFDVAGPRLPSHLVTVVDEPSYPVVQRSLLRHGWGQVLFVGNGCLATVSNPFCHFLRLRFNFLSTRTMWSSTTSMKKTGGIEKID